MITCFRAVGPYRSDQNGLSGAVGIAPDTFTALMSAALATANMPRVKAIISAFINLLCFTVLPPLTNSFRMEILLKPLSRLTFRRCIRNQIVFHTIGQ